MKEIVKEGRMKMRGLAKMGDQAMESLGTEARGGQDSDSKRRRELLLLRREEGAASATKGGGSCFCYEGRKEMLLLRRGGGSCFCYEGRRELLLLRERMRRELYY